MKKQNNTETVGTISKSNIKIVERDKIDILNTQIHDCSLVWFGTDTSIKKSGMIKPSLSVK